MASSEEVIVKAKKAKHVKKADTASLQSENGSEKVVKLSKKPSKPSTEALVMNADAISKVVRQPNRVSAVSVAASAVASQQKSQFGAKLVCGAIAGVVGTCVIFPLDTVKTQLMTQKPGPVSCHVTRMNTFLLISQQLQLHYFLFILRHRDCHSFLHLMLINRMAFDLINMH
jgi:hypothetical protein